MHFGRGNLKITDQLVFVIDDEVIFVAVVILPLFSVQQRTSLSFCRFTGGGLKMLGYFAPFDLGSFLTAVALHGSVD